MIRYTFAAVIAGLLAAVPVVHAGELPYPTVDFQADWVVRGPDSEVMDATMHYRASGKQMRLKMQQQGMAMSSIQNMETGEVIVWSDQMPGMAMRIRSETDDPDILPQRTGETKTVNGEACTVWTADRVQVCLTDENIPLETTGEGFSATLRNLDRSTQDAGLFAPPAELRVMDMPTGMPGAENMMPGMGLPF
jgi:hypothetical protein